MKSIIPFLLGFAVLLSCSQTGQQVDVPDNNSRYYVDEIEMDWSDNAEEIKFRFNIMDKRTDEKVLWNELNKEHVTVFSENKQLTVKELSRLISSKGYIPENILVMLLVDRNIGDNDMDHVRNAVHFIVNNLPQNTVYISFFDDQLRSPVKITSDNLEAFQDEFVAHKNDKILFDVALIKFRELCGVKGTASDQQLIERIEDNDIKKYLVLLTDGRVNENNVRTADNIQRFSEYVQQLDNDATNRKRIEIHALRYGEVTEDVDQTLSYICVDLRNENVKGGFYIAAPESFIEKLKISDALSPDYELTVFAPEDFVDLGFIKDLHITLAYDEMTADGQTEYTIGSLLRPVKAGSFRIVWRLLLGILIWTVLFVLVLCFVHIVIPYIRFDVVNFERKYVRNYSFDHDTVLQCHYCLNEIKDEEEIVTKCRHIVHKNCWVENGCKCADYGEGCKEGKQYFFDFKRPFSKENRPYFTPFAWYGMIGGLITWLIYQLLIYFFPYPLESFINYLFTKFYPGYDESQAIFLRAVYILKTTGFLIVGILLGFIAVYTFVNLNRIRQRSYSFMWVLFKSILGGIIGFAAFLVGVLLILSLKVPYTNVWLDWIPWIMAGGAWGLCLSFRENVVWSHVILGGIISGFLCFIVLLLGKWWGCYAVLIGFMLLSALLGISLVIARRTIHTYFLKYQGKQSGRIAIHKWMSVAGGSQDVTIGQSKECTICLNWDNHNSLRDVNVRLYVDKKYNVPCLKVMDEHMIYDRSLAKKNDEFILKHGVSFKIGNTSFQYIEKTK